MKNRIIKKLVIGTFKKPRLFIFKSHKNLYVQLINDQLGHSLFSCSSKNLYSVNLKDTNMCSAYFLGFKFGLNVIKLNIHTVILNIKKKAYCGQIKSVCEGAKATGLIF